MEYTILVVDECPMVRRGVTQFFETTEEFRVVGEAGDAETALVLMQNLLPDVVFIEPNFTVNSTTARLPDIELCRRLKNFSHDPQIIIYTANDSPLDIASVVLAGASGYVHKGLNEAQFVSAIRGSLSENPRWIFGLDEEYAGEVTRSAMKFSRLSPREKIILPFILRRYSTKETATELYLHPQTVQNHVTSILRKLDCKKKSDLYETWKL